jgi:hypothetical protein
MAHFPFWYFLFKTYISLYYLPTCNKKLSSPHVASYLRVSFRVKLSKLVSKFRAISRTSSNFAASLETIVYYRPYSPTSFPPFYRHRISFTIIPPLTPIANAHLRTSSRCFAKTSDHFALPRTTSHCFTCIPNLPPHFVLSLVDNGDT